MRQWGFYFNQTRCANCKSCVYACKAWNEDKRKENMSYSDPYKEQEGIYKCGPANFHCHNEKIENWREIYVTEYGCVPPDVDVLNLSISCNHCDNPVCVKVCRSGYIYKEQDYGIVMTDKNKPCVRCGLCRKYCPWDSPKFYVNLNNDDNIKPAMTKCDLCIDRIKEGLKPACVASCIMRALDAGPLDELKEKYPDWTDKIENFPEGLVGKLKIKVRPNIIFKKRSKRIGKWIKTL